VRRTAAPALAPAPVALPETAHCPASGDQPAGLSAPAAAAASGRAHGPRKLQPTAKVPRVNPVHANAQAAALTVSQVGATAPTNNADEQTGGAAFSLRAGPGATAAFYIMKYMGKD